MGKTTGKVNAEAARALQVEAAPFWAPDTAGDEIGGEIVAIVKARSTKYPAKGEYIILVLDAAPDGYCKVDCGGTVLARLIKERAPEVGRHVAIRYLGEGREKEDGSKPCKRYALAVI